MPFLLQDTDQLKIFLNTFLSLESSNGLPIESFLLKPVQRISQYPYLLRQILEKRRENSPGREELEKAIEKLEEVVESVNERRKQVENSQIIMDIEQKLVGEKHDLLTPTRRQDFFSFPFFSIPCRSFDKIPLTFWQVCSRCRGFQSIFRWETARTASLPVQWPFPTRFSSKWKEGQASRQNRNRSW